MRLLSWAAGVAAGAFLFMTTAPSEAFSGHRECRGHCGHHVHRHMRHRATHHRSRRLGLFRRHRARVRQVYRPAPRLPTYRTVKRHVMVRPGQRSFIRTPGQYRTHKMRVMTKAPRLRFHREPDVYKTVMQDVMVKRGSSRLVRTPDVTKTVYEKVRVGGRTRLTRCHDVGHGGLKDGGHYGHSDGDTGGASGGSDGGGGGD